LNSEGALWIDQIEILIDGGDFREAPKKYIPKAATDEEFDTGSSITADELSRIPVSELEKLCWIWGFLKYYHPNIAKGDFNWDYELFRFIKKLSDVSMAGIDSDSLYLDWISSLGEYQINEIKEKPNLLWVATPLYGVELKDALLRLISAKRDGNNYYVRNYSSIPLFQEASYSQFQMPDAGFRLLALFRYWNMVQYYYPYQSVIGEDWSDIIGEFLPRFISAKTRIDYFKGLMMLFSRINDGHAYCNDQSGTAQQIFGNRAHHTIFSFIGDTLVVTDHYLNNQEEHSPLEIGDVITHIGDKPIRDIVSELGLYVSASNQVSKLNRIAPIMSYSHDSILNIRVLKANNHIVNHQLKTYPLNEFLFQRAEQGKDTSSFRFVAPGIGYIYSNTMTSTLLSTYLEDIKKCDALIVDLRTYPRRGTYTHELIKHLYPNPTSFYRFATFDPVMPGIFHLETLEQYGFENPDYFKGLVVGIVNEETFSHTEFSAMALQAAPRCLIVGATTAGADGNNTPIPLPGGIYSGFSSVGVYYPDGGETQRVGIVPDVCVYPTVKSVREKEDIVLRKSIEIIQNCLKEQGV
jgi:Periplasmic protease